MLLKQHPWFLGTANVTNNTGNFKPLDMPWTGSALWPTLTGASFWCQIANMPFWHATPFRDAQQTLGWRMQCEAYGGVYLRFELLQHPIYADTLVIPGMNWDSLATPARSSIAMPPVVYWAAPWYIGFT